MALKFGGFQEGKTEGRPLQDLDLSPLANLAGGFLGGIGEAWKKRKARPQDQPFDTSNVKSEEELSMLTDEEREAYLATMSEGGIDPYLQKKKEQELIDNPRSSIASDVGGLLTGVWDRITGKGRNKGDITTKEAVPGYAKPEGQSINSLTDLHKLIGSGTITDYSQIPEEYRDMIDEASFNKISAKPSPQLSSMIANPDITYGQGPSIEPTIENKGLMGVLTPPFNIDQLTKWEY